MFSRIAKLKEKGYIPDIIFDIGAYHGNWTRECLKIYPYSKYLLFEPNEYNEINSLKNIRNIRVFHSLLNDKNIEIDWYEMKTTGDSIFREKSKHYVSSPIIKKTSVTLNNVLNEKNGILENCNKILIKIDCQGSEIPILKGATNILNITNFIILELPLFGEYNENVPGFLEHIKFMDEIGFIPYDFLENHYVCDFNMQIDMLFINKNHTFNKIVQQHLL